MKLGLADENKNEIDYTKAFQIVPTTGFQKMEFSLNIIDTKLLDYENVEWQKFQIKVIKNRN